jgi:hypothetical protein
MKDDPDLAALRGDPRFLAINERAKELAAEVRKPN